MFLLAALLSSSLAAEPAPAAPAALPPVQTFPTAGEAVATLLATRPRVIGVGEQHATTDGPTVPTTLARFTTAMLPTLAPHTTDLVLETWRLDGTCGPTEEVVATAVEQDLARPARTKSELEVLVETSVALGVRPHDLALSCAEYSSMLAPDGSVVYGTLLTILTDKLRAFALRGLAVPDATLVLYGGAVHNDVNPRADLAAYAYGPAVVAAGGAAYLELDVYAPELLRGNTLLLEPSWAPLLDRAGPDHVVLFPRGPQSWVLLLETTPG